MLQRFAVQSVVPAALVVALALLAAPVMRAVTASLTAATNRTWPFSLEHPHNGFALVVASRGRGG